MAQLRHLAGGADIFFANLFDKSYARDVGGTTGEHAYPELFHADTTCGTYQGVTDQVIMTATPGDYRVSWGCSACRALMLGASGDVVCDSACRGVVHVVHWAGGHRRGWQASGVSGGGCRRGSVTGPC